MNIPGHPSRSTQPSSLWGFGELSVLLTVTDDAVSGPNHEWRLPGTFLHEDETLAAAVLRSLRDKAGIKGLAPANCTSSTNSP